MALYPPGARLWLNPERWVEATVDKVQTVTGPLGTPTYAYTLRSADSEHVFYEMTLRNFQWLKSQEAHQEAHQEVSDCTEVET